jgi:hypothetical protein
MKKDITELFCFVDDFYQITEEWLKKQSISAGNRVTREPGLSISEIMTIMLLYHQSPCKNFKFFYYSYLQLYRAEFPKLLSYNRFIELKSRSLTYLAMLLEWYIKRAEDTKISYIDSTSIAVCHPKRISRNKVFKGVAEISKSTKGWFYGFKLHLVINEKGEIQGAKFTAGNVDDRVPVPEITKRLTGLLLGDKGYIKQDLFNTLYNRGLKLVTGIKKGMKNQLVCLFEKILLRKRSVIETVFDIMKNHFELEHTRHRSIPNAFVHLVSTLIAYCLKPTKPSIKSIYIIPN